RWAGGVRNRLGVALAAASARGLLGGAQGFSGFAPAFISRARPVACRRGLAEPRRRDRVEDRRVAFGELRLGRAQRRPSGWFRRRTGGPRAGARTGQPVVAGLVWGRRRAPRRLVGGSGLAGLVGSVVVDRPDGLAG